jgi:hypothetical protein
MNLGVGFYSDAVGDVIKNMAFLVIPVVVIPLVMALHLVVIPLVIPSNSKAHRWGIW